MNVFDVLSSKIFVRFACFGKVGSVHASRRGETEFAGIHLLDHIGSDATPNSNSVSSSPIGSMKRFCPRILTELVNRKFTSIFWTFLPSLTQAGFLLNDGEVTREKI